MARTLFCAAVLLSASGLSGCMQEAKLVLDRDAFTGATTGGAVIVPDKSNDWPNYWRDEAYAKIKEVYPTFDPADVVSQGPVKISAQTPNGQGNTMTVSDKTEYRYVFRIQKAVAGGAANATIVPVGGAQRNSNGQLQQSGYPIGGRPANLDVGMSQNAFGIKPPIVDSTVTPPTGNSPMIPPTGNSPMLPPIGNSPMLPTTGNSPNFGMPGTPAQGFPGQR
jgi:hypothetical protein